MTITILVVLKICQKPSWPQNPYMPLVSNVVILIDYISMSSLFLLRLQLIVLVSYGPFMGPTKPKSEFKCTIIAAIYCVDL